MKKLLLIPIFFLTLVSSVYADETPTNPMSTYYDHFDDALNYYYENQTIYNELLSLYIDNYSTNFPYYFVKYEANTGGFLLSYSNLNIFTQMTAEYIPELVIPTTCYNNMSSCLGQIQYLEGGSITELSVEGGWQSLYWENVISAHGMIYGDTNTLHIPAYTSSDYNVSFQYFEIENGDFLPSYLDLYDGEYSPSISYTEINLNNYPYVALSLKDYNRDPFSTNFIVKGQLCLTPVYNYGMSDIANYNSPSYQTQECTIPYENFTPMREYILQTDIDNKAIYYLKAYNTSIENIVKVDTNIFNITYITQQNENNPSVIIGGRSYPTIPYNDLTTTATKSTQEGYVSGRVENVFDVSSDSNYISNLFSNPLQTLQSVWTSIITMFALVGSFIALLPPILQAFLYTGFSIGIVLGVLKILL